MLYSRHLLVHLRTRHRLGMPVTLVRKLKIFLTTWPAMYLECLCQHQGLWSLGTLRLVLADQRLAGIHATSFPKMIFVKRATRPRLDAEWEHGKWHPVDTRLVRKVVVAMLTGCANFPRWTYSLRLHVYPGFSVTFSFLVITVPMKFGFQTFCTTAIMIYKNGFCTGHS